MSASQVSPIIGAVKSVRHILVIEDDPKTGASLVMYLDQAGYKASLVRAGDEGLARARREKPDLVILDLMLPGMSGYEICRALRASSAIPIIMLTARATEEDTLRGLALGADDYVTKPFSPRELVARVAAVLRRGPASQQDGDLALNPEAREVTLRGEAVTLTTAEFDILEMIGAPAAQQPSTRPPQRIVVGGGGPDIPPDWPQPELREGLTKAQILDAIVAYGQKVVDTDHLSGVLLVAKDGKPVLSRAWGMANATEKNTLETKFNIGSINKVLTKTAIDQLAAAGKLAYDDTIRAHLRDYPSPIADRVTIRQLLDHRSGLGDIFGPKYMNAPPSRLRENADFLKLFVDEPLQFEPGTSQRYSNAGYVVLGLIIERISGATYRDYVQSHIFTPAGMTNSGFWTVDEAVPHRATGYTLRGPDGPLTERTPNTATLPGRPSSAGGAYSTAGDLLKLFQWLPGSGRGGGLGVAGGAPGLNAAVEIAAGWTVIVMSNYDPPSAEAFARAVQMIIAGRRGPDSSDAGAPMRRAPSAPAKTDMPGNVAVPLTPLQHLVSVETQVNGRGPYRFVVDSGAAGLLRVSPALAKTLALEEIGMARSGDPSGRNAREVPIVRVDSVQIGGATFSGVDATVSAGPAGLAQEDGVIGLGLFGGLTVTLDYPRSELRLSRESLPAPAGGPDTDTHVIAFTSERGVPQIDVLAAGVTLAADVDTGSPAFLSVSPAMKLPLAGEPRIVGKGRTASNEFDIRAAELNGELRIAGWPSTNPTIDIVDLFPVANIGSRFLRQYVVTFDLPNKRLALRR